MARPRNLDLDVDCLGADMYLMSGNCNPWIEVIRINEGCSLIECRSRWSWFTVRLALLLAVVGCATGCP